MCVRLNQFGGSTGRTDNGKSKIAPEAGDSKAASFVKPMCVSHKDLQILIQSADFLCLIFFRSMIQSMNPAVSPCKSPSSACAPSRVFGHAVDSHHHD